RHTSFSRDWSSDVCSSDLALNKCERTIFNYLKIQQKATFFWDYPQLLLTEKQDPSNPVMKVMHEGGLFMKQNIYDFPSPENWERSEERRVGKEWRDGSQGS